MPATTEHSNLPPKSQVRRLTFSLSISDLESILNQRRQELEGKQARKADLLKQLSALDEEIEQMKGSNGAVPMATPSQTEVVARPEASTKPKGKLKRKYAANGTTMPQMAAQVFRDSKNRPMRAKDVKDELLRRKFATTQSHSTFGTSVASMLGQHKWFLKVRTGVYRLRDEYMNPKTTQFFRANQHSKG